MNAALPAQWRWAGLVAALALLVWAVSRLPWDKVRGDAEAQRVWAIFTAVLVLMRGLFDTHAVMGVQLHFLGAAIATLMFGWRFALLSTAIASAVAAVFGRAWLGWGWDHLATGQLPVAVTVAVGWAVNRWLPPNFFIYVFGNAFFAAAVSMAASVLAKAGLTALLGGVAAPYLIAAIPMAFGEAFFSGGTMALIVAYRPQWCASFDDARYLAKRD